MKTETLQEWLDRGGKIEKITVPKHCKISRGIVIAPSHKTRQQRANLVAKIRKAPMNEVPALLKQVPKEQREKLFLEIQGIK